MTNVGAKAAEAEVAASVDRLFTCAAWADKYDGAAKGVPIRGVALAMNEPVGVIGAFCADEAPLLGLVSVLAPALAMGNRVVAVASEPFPLAATDFYQVLETSDVPAGVVNILTGSHAELAAAAGRPCRCGRGLELFARPTLGGDRGGKRRQPEADLGATTGGRATGCRRMRAEFLAQATEVKTIWIPYGE